MNIIVAIITRENPLGLTTLVGGLDGLASGNHDIRYVIRYDDDDQASYEAIQRLSHYLPDKVYGGVVGPRPVTLGQAWNEALQGGWLKDWEVAVTLPNDVIPLSDKWDDVIADVLSPKSGRYAVSWQQLCDPTNPVFPTIRREWYEAVGNKLFPEWFPFWFSDTWIIEVHQLVFGSRLPLVGQNRLTLGGKHDKTSGMRDLQFWFSFFRATRSLRIEEAGRLAGALGRSPYDLSPAIAEMEKHDAWQLDRIPLYEKWFGADNGDPPERYLLAKSRAEEWLLGQGLGV